MNILVYIDPSWSYRFFEFNKPAISKLDFFTFMDDFYSAAMLFIKTHANHKFGLSSTTYNAGITGAMDIGLKYPELSNKLTQAFLDLHHTHRVSFSALQGPITKMQTVCDDTGILTGIIVTVEIRSVLTPILHL